MDDLLVLSRTGCVGGGKHHPERYRKAGVRRAETINPFSMSGFWGVLEAKPFKLFVPTYTIFWNYVMTTICNIKNYRDRLGSVFHRQLRW